MKVDQTYELVSLQGDTDVLKEHPQNPRIGDEEVIDESIDINGWYGAVVAQRSTGYILAGNHRYRVARKRGAAEIPVIWKDVDDQTALRILLVDNKSADAGTYNEQLLTQVLESLETLDGTGYGLAALEEEDEPEKDGESDDEGDDDVPDDRYEPAYGIMVTCDSEDDQQAVYEQLAGLFGDDRELKVVAV